MRSTADPAREVRLRIAPPGVILIEGDTATATTSVADGPQATWAIEDSSVANVTGDGELHGRRPGLTRLIATRNGMNTYANVRVLQDSLPDLYVIAHRGFAGVFPENTLIAVNKAFDIGADAVEMDVAMSKDRVPMLMHDSTIDRTTTGHGAIAELTSEQLQQVDACSKFGTQWGPCPVPTVNEALQAAHGRGRVLLHLKGPWPPSALDTLLVLVRQQRMRRDVVVIDFDSKSLTYVQSRDSLLAVGLLGDVSAMRTAPALHRFALLMFEGNLEAQAANVQAFRLKALANGGAVGAWTIKSSVRASALRALGVGWMISDVPLDIGSLAVTPAP